MDNIEYEVEGVEYTSNYKKFEPNNPLHRPEIKYIKAVFSIFIYLVITVVIYMICEHYVRKLFGNYKMVYSIIVSLCVGFVYIATITKKAVIWFVKVYQHYAPTHIRLRCAFEPSCSEYMILAVEKYGVIKGVFKGIKRLLRCHPPGGVDYP